MNAGPTAERVHDALKQEIMNGHFRPGARLDPAVLAADLASSTTPVREALSRLVGAGLVESRTGGGFHMPSLDEPRLKDMYGWSRELLALALRGWPREAEPGAAAPPRPVAAQGQIAEHAAGLFAAIGQRSLNCEHGRAIRRLGDRLHAVRTIEPLVVSGTLEELEQLEAAVRAGNRNALRGGLGAYHRRRIRAAAAILRALHRPG